MGAIQGLLPQPQEEDFHYNLLVLPHPSIPVFICRL